MTYKEAFEEAHVVICWKRGIYKFIKGNNTLMNTSYLPQEDVIRFLMLDRLRALYCDEHENIIECNFNK